MTWILAPDECHPSPHVYQGRKRGRLHEPEPHVFILHYAVDGDQREDDDDTDQTFTERERDHDCMDVVRAFQKPKRYASTHFVVGRDGSRAQCVKTEDASWGAGDRGKSRFPTVHQLDRADFVPIGEVEKRPRWVNMASTQVELCNAGYAVDMLRIPEHDQLAARHPAMQNPRQWEVFTDYQYSSLELLAALLRLKQPTLKYVCGHEDVTNRDTLRQRYGGKFDPGPAFNWGRIDWAKMGYQRVRYDFERKGWRSRPK